MNFTAAAGPVRRGQPSLGRGAVLEAVLDQALCQHGVGYLDEAGDVGAHHVVAR